MKYLDTSWDFIGADTKRFTHCYHNYPAMMIPQIAERLLEKYGKNAKLLFDPYCGTGTSLLEANLKGINAIGTDLNPLARLIAKTKTSKTNIQILELYLKEFNDYLFSLLFDFEKINVVVPAIKNIDFWFSDEVQHKLAILKIFIENIQDESSQDFFKIAFSETVRESSYTKNSEFKMYRMNANQMEKFKPDVFNMMQNKLARSHNGLKALLQQKNIADTQVFEFNTSNEIKNINENEVDIVITSPPYGDSRTTVAYGQFSRLANEWLGCEDANQVDNSLMGGKTYKNINNFENELLNEKIEKISNIDIKRAKDVVAFYLDYEKSINNVAKLINKNGYVCYVVGNRKVKGETLPTDEITKDFFEKQGFKHIETIIRNIPNKRMPSKNSPSNIAGITDSTMNNEYVVIMQKN